MSVTLADYQTEARDWLLDNPRAILADEAGVGKTFSALAALKESPSPRLVVVPAHLISQWRREASRLGVDLVPAEGPSTADREKVIGDAEDLVCSYDLLSRPGYQQLLSSKKFKTQVYDEAHRLRGRKAKRTKFQYHLAKRAKRVWFVTATPLYSGPSDVWPLLRTCDPKAYRSYWRFVDQHCHVEVTPWAKKVGGLLDPEHFGRKVLGPWILRRTLEEVGISAGETRDLPTMVDPEPQLLKDHKSAQERYVLSGEILSSAIVVYTRLRQICAASKNKLKAFKEILEDLPGERIVVFAWHHETKHALMEVCGKVKRKAYCSGDTGDPNKAIGPWKRTKDGVLVLTIGGAREGLDGLQQYASCCILYEQDTVESGNQQAIGRLARRGQEKPVRVIRPILSDTLDEKIWDVSQGKYESLQEALMEAGK